MAPARDNVDVITDAIERVDGGAIVPRGAAGERRHAVTLAVSATRPPMRFDPAPYIVEMAGRDAEAMAA